MNNWKVTTIEECTDVLGDGLHGTPKYKENGEYAFINGNNLVNGRILIKEDTRRVSFEEYEKYKKPLNDRTIFVSINGTLGNVGTYNGEKVILGKSACFFNVKESVDKDFIYYVVNSTDFKRYMELSATGTTIKNFSLKQMREYEFKIPDITQQRKVSSILRNIDDKIRNNQSINDNLEQQAQALFKKMFPDVLEDTASDCFESIISFSNGKKRPQSDGNVPVYGGNGILAYTSEVNANNCVVIGRVGAYCGNTFLCQGNCWVSDNAIQAKSKNEDSQIFVYYLLKNASLPTRHIGTGQPLMTQGILNAIPVSVPEQNAINNFIDNVSPMHKLISANLEENAKLVKTRDILLPQLLSGELDVSNLDI